MKPLRWEWSAAPPVDVPPGFAESLGLPLFAAQALVRRGIGTPDQARAFFDPSTYRLASPFDLPDLDAGAERLLHAIRKQEHIGVWGDFDVDGQTSTTLLVSLLRELGAQVSYYIPVRQRESHGVNPAALGDFLDRGIQLLLTCDTGIRDHDAVVYAQSRGVETIITDHHSLPETLPPARAAINPQRLPDGHPMKWLCGVGCAYQLMRGVAQACSPGPDLESVLDLVALGTIADLALLRDDNRCLVQLGLERIRRSPRFTLQIMAEAAGSDLSAINEEQIGYVLAPRLNALGRLDDANPAVDFLLTQDAAQARFFAQKVEALNNRRKLICDQVFDAAQDQLERSPELARQPAIVLSHPAWPAGVVGIAASRLVERYRKPVILISAPPGENARGSARSVEGVDITAAIRAQADLLAGFGGHPMAAGLSIAPENIPAFAQRLGKRVQQSLPVPVTPRLVIDAEIGLDEIHLELGEQLKRLSPYGQGNPPLVLASRDLHVVNNTTLGRDQAHRKLVVEDAGGHRLPVVFWNGADLAIPEGEFDLAFYLGSNNYKGAVEIQLTGIDVQPGRSPAVQLTPRQGIEIIDLRQLTAPDRYAQALAAAGPEAQVWFDGNLERSLPGRHRLELVPGPALVVWSTPPGPAEYRQVVATVQPQRLVLVASPADTDQPLPFLKSLSGLLLYACRQHQGWIRFAELAALTNQRIGTVLKGLGWLVARGKFEYCAQDGDRFQFQKGGVAQLASTSVLEEELKHLLSETAAYRRYFQRTEAGQLRQQIDLQ
ncbi:MAG: single-stranded-DNA-specific exonuclease RecJ [Chloroflexi bacterium]|nr:single-stranded-DNA-specific exonuclease RecJ [Chloroflexota bacterium]